MYQQDYILRLIETVGAVFRRMVFLIRNGQPAEALEISREAVELVAETDIGLIDALTAESVLSLLSAGGTLDAPRVALLGLALRRRADALEASGQLTEAARQRDKAEVLLEAAVRKDPDVKEILEGLG